MDADKNSKPKRRVQEDPIDVSRGTSREFDWPRPLHYTIRHGNTRVCARQFLKYRLEPIISSEGQLYSLHFATNMWTPVSDSEIAAEIAKTDPGLRLRGDEVHKMVRDIHLDCNTNVRPGMWIKQPPGAPDPEDIIIFRNGLLNLQTMELIPHSADFFVTTTPDYDYDPGATCPRFKKFLGQVLDTSFHPTLQEWMGYLLTTATNHHAIMQLIGASGGGKGTILRVAERMVGHSNTGSTTMDDLAKDTGLEGLENVRLIAIPEAKDARDNRANVLARLLSISGGDALPINRKNKTRLRRPIPGKIMLAANEFLSMLDNHDALKRRSLVLVFERSFAAAPDRHLDSKLAAELPGIANWAIRGLKRLQREGRFSVGTAGLEAVEKLALAGSPIKRFIRDHINVTGGKSDYIKTEHLFDGYRDWAAGVERMNPRHVLGKSHFLSAFEACLRGHNVKLDQRSIKAGTKWKRARGMFGVDWSDRPEKPSS